MHCLEAGRNKVYTTRVQGTFPARGGGRTWFSGILWGDWIQLDGGGKRKSTGKDIEYSRGNVFYRHGNFYLLKPIKESTREELGSEYVKTPAEIEEEILGK